MDILLYAILTLVPTVAVISVQGRTPVRCFGSLVLGCAILTGTGLAYDVIAGLGRTPDQASNLTAALSALMSKFAISMLLLSFPGLLFLGGFVIGNRTLAARRYDAFWVNAGILSIGATACAYVSMQVAPTSASYIPGLMGILLMIMLVIVIAGMLIAGAAGRTANRDYGTSADPPDVPRRRGILWETVLVGILAVVSMGLSFLG